MTKKQLKLIEVWIVISLLVVTLIIFENDEWNVRWMFVPVILYMILNWSHINEFQTINPKPTEILENNQKIKYLVYGSAASLILAAFIILLSGINIVNYLGFGGLLLLLSSPFLPILIASQYALFQELKK
ncbi:MAG: hypothetical protein ABW157_04770 [Candidatus Thiodiazotropha sp. LLP2]